MANTQHIRLKGRQWQFYKRVPSELQGAFEGKKTMTRNLQTSDLVKAQRARDVLVRETENKFARARKGLPVNAVSDDPFKQLEADALAWREHLKTLNPGEREDLESVLSDTAEKIEQKHGYPAAKSYYDIATEAVMPLADTLLEQFFTEEPCVGTTQEKRKGIFRRLKKWLGPSRSTVEAVTKKVAGEYVSYMLKQDLRASSINDNVNGLSAIWKWMGKKGINTTDENPWRNQTLPLKKHNRQADDEDDAGKAAWTREEVQELITNVPAPNHLLRDAIMIGALSGMRSKELCDLKVKHIVTAQEGDQPFQLFDITKGKTSASNRKVPVHSQLQEIIARRIEGKNPEDYLIDELNHSKALRHTSVLSKSFTKHSRKLFPQYSANEERRQAVKDFHSLRRYFITAREQAGCFPWVTDFVVGHKRQGMGLGVYSKGPSLEQRSQCVEAVKMV